MDFQLKQFEYIRYNIRILIKKKIMMTQKQAQELIDVLDNLTREVAMLNSGEIYGGTLTDAINFLAEQLSEKK